MKRAFQIGDRVVIVRSPFRARIGEVARITSGLEMARWVGDGPNVPEGLMHRLDLRPLPGALGAEVVCYPPCWLEPYRNDGNEKARWTRQLRKLCGRVEVKS